jgi:uncharacterized membrane protein
MNTFFLVLALTLAVLQQSRPYFRKYISNKLEHHEYFFLMSLFVLVITICYLIYLWLTDKVCVKMMTYNFTTLTSIEMMCVIILSLLTVVSGIMLFELDKNFNTPLINTIFIKSIGALAIVFVGIVIFEETYSYCNFLGIAMILMGLYLVMVERK